MDINKSFDGGNAKAREWMTKHPTLTGFIFVFFIIFLISMFSGSDDPQSSTESVQQPIVENTQVVAENKNANLTPAVGQKTNNTSVKTETKIIPTTTPTPVPAPATETKTDREKAIEIIKANASAKWGTDYEMINYTVKNQTVAYDWVAKQTQHLDIMARAKTKWQNDYEMIKYTYENQVVAYNWIASQTAYPDIMARAKQKWGGDYEMVKYEYENQVAAYEAQ